MAGIRVRRRARVKKFRPLLRPSALFMKEGIIRRRKYGKTRRKAAIRERIEEGGRERGREGKRQ